jgi:hypothetical protein
MRTTTLLLLSWLVAATAWASFTGSGAFTYSAGGGAEPGDTAPPEGAIAIAQADVPKTINSAGDYYLSENLSAASGSAITITANGVKIWGNNKSIAYAQSGAGNAIYYNVGNTSGALVNGVTFNQGAYSGNTYVYAIRGSGYGYTIHDNDFNVVAHAGYSTRAYGIRIESSGVGNELYNNNFDLSGADRFYAFYCTGTWDIHHNTVLVHNHTLPSDGRYPYVFNIVGYNYTIHDNTITVQADSRAVNVYAAWSPTADGHEIYNETINFAGDHGRIFLMDSGTDNWNIHDNDITVTSQNGSGNSVAVFRARSSNTNDAGSTGHIIHSNNVDASGSDADTSIVSLGDDPPNATADILIYNNIFKSSGDVIKLYSYDGMVSNVDIYSNILEHTGGNTGGYVVTSNDPAYSDIVFSHNEISTNRSDGDKVYTTYNNSSNITLCQSDVTASDVAGGGSVTVTESTCQNNWLGTPIQTL